MCVLEIEIIANACLYLSTHRDTVKIASVSQDSGSEDAGTMLRSSTRGVASLPTGICPRLAATAPPSAPAPSRIESRARGEAPPASLPHGPISLALAPASRALSLPSRASSLPLRTRGGAFCAGGGEGCEGAEGAAAPPLYAARPPASALGGCGVLAGGRAALIRASSAGLMKSCPSRCPPARRAKRRSRACRSHSRAEGSSSHRVLACGPEPSHCGRGRALRRESLI